MRRNCDNITRVCGILKKCKSILFITGAGISADSGLPTYRGVGGLYNEKVTEDGIPIEMALAGEMLRKRPEVTWKYLSQIEKKCRGATFNIAHKIIADMEKHFERVWVLTQNIDGFHRSAGSKNVIDIHGNMYTLICPDCKWRKKLESYADVEIPPRCPECNSVVRPEVVFFGEPLPDDKCKVLTREAEKGFDVYFSIGTNSVFPYIQQPVINARLSNKPTIEINPGETEVSHLVDIKISLGAREALEDIWNRYKLSG